MNIKLPREIASEVGCSEVMLRKINQGTRRPSPGLARKIIQAMRQRGIEVNPVHLLPDLMELLQPDNGNGNNSAAPDAD